MVRFEIDGKQSVAGRMSMAYGMAMASTYSSSAGDVN